MSTFEPANGPRILVGGEKRGDWSPIKKPKRYLVFAGSNYYPAGGWNDYIGSADTAEDAGRAAIASHNDWWDVIDAETGENIVVTVL